MKRMKCPVGPAALFLAVLFFGLSAVLTLREEQTSFVISPIPADAAVSETESLSADEDGAVISLVIHVPLNTASAKELTALPGVGETLAEAIVRYREEYGPFRTPEDLMDVPGIGEGVMDAIRAQMP